MASKDSAALRRYRREMDGIYSRLVPLLARRAQLVEHIALEKKRLGLKVKDSGREAAVLSDARSKLSALGKSRRIVSQTVSCLSALMAHARNVQSRKIRSRPGKRRT